MKGKRDMNGWKKAYCRTFQFAFRAASPLLPYREPKCLSSVAEIGEELKAMHIQSVLLVTDKFLRSAGLTRTLEAQLADAGIRYAVYDDTRPNPTIENVEQARSMYLEHDCEALIAVGGGSAIDCAKGAGARIVNPKRGMDKMEGILKVFRKLPPIIAVPTTAGTGSEATVTAVVTDDARKHKYTVSDFVLIPSHAVHDPEMTATLPPHLTAVTGMDALTHAVEAYIGGTVTRTSGRLALEATRLVFENLEKAYADGRDMEARRNMLRASYMAGRAFSISYVGYIHAVAHSLGGQYNIPHGLANSVLLPYGLEMYGTAVYKKLHALAVAAGIARKEDDCEQAARRFIDEVRAMNRRMKIPEKLQGIRKEDIPVMARHADREANPVYPVPVLMDAKQLEKLYEIVSEE